VATIEIKKSKFSILMQYVEEVLLEIQEIALNNTGKLLKKKTALCHCDYAKNAKNMNFLVYSLSLNNALFLDLKGRVKLKLQENGFHDKTGKELENYIEETALLLLHTNRNSVKQRIDLIVDELKGKDQKRFPDSLAITAYRKVVYKAIEIKNSEIEEIEKLKKKYNLLYYLKDIIKRLKNNPALSINFAMYSAFIIMMVLS